MTEQLPQHPISTTLWMSQRNLDSFHLAATVDDTPVAIPIRQSLDNYFSTLGGVPLLETTDEALGWAEDLQKAGCFPEAVFPSHLEPGERVRLRLARPIALGLGALANELIKDTNEDFGAVVKAFRRSMASAKHNLLSDVLRRSISEEKLYEGLLLADSAFTSIAFKNYLDSRSREKGFVGAMKKAAQARLKLLPPKLQPPADVRPWEVGLE